MVWSDPLNQFFACFEVSGICTSVQLVLKPVLYVVLKPARDIVSVSDVPNSGQGYCHSKLICKAWEVRLDTASKVAVSI